VLLRGLGAALAAAGAAVLAFAFVQAEEHVVFVKGFVVVHVDSG
jgi:hypothetical protein